MRAKRCWYCGYRFERDYPALSRSPLTFAGDGGEIVMHANCWATAFALVAGQQREIECRVWLAERGEGT